MIRYCRTTLEIAYKAWPAVRQRWGVPNPIIEPPRALEESRNERD